jgi:hypothetical protein
LLSVKKKENPADKAAAAKKEADKAAAKKAADKAAEDKAAAEKAVADKAAEKAQDSTPRPVNITFGFRSSRLKNGHPS